MRRTTGEMLIDHGLHALLADPRRQGRLVDQACSQMVSAVIVEDTGLSSAQAELLASGLLGLAEAAARRWLRDCVESPDTSISLEEAADLVGSLAWRGIRSFPLSHPPSA